MATDSNNPSGHEPPAPDIGRPDSINLAKIDLADTETSATPPAGRATGPRTPEGKEESKRNAIKHGIFSDVVVLKGESRAQYESLLGGLWRTLQPDGKLEEILVEKAGNHCMALPTPDGGGRRRDPEGHRVRG